jgi:hypothetical protein
LSWTKRLFPMILAALVIESVVIALPFIDRSFGNPTLIPGNRQSMNFQFTVFNQPISMDTDARLSPSYNQSWQITIRSTLTSTAGKSSQAQMAFSPEYVSENLSIPTIIVQERGDGLLRIEYFAQNWPNTYGLVLWNSTSPSWTSQGNLTIRFVSFGPAAEVNPTLAPRPNGNVTIELGGTVLLADYPIAWASLGDVYLYGLPTSSFNGGSIQIDFQSLAKG